MPTLHETVKFCKSNGLRMLFDVKHFNEKVVDEIAFLFERYDLFETGIVSSFIPAVPFFVKRRNANILTGYTWRRFCYSTSGECDFTPKHSGLYSLAMQFYDELNHQLTSHFVLPLFLGVDMVLVNHHDVCKMTVDYAKHHGLQVVAWTCNDPVEAYWIQNYLKIPMLTDSYDTIRTLPAKSWMKKILSWFGLFR